MKNYLLALLLIPTLAWSGDAFKGTSVSGTIALSGILKKLVLDDAIPLGSLGGSHGYEVWNFDKYTKDNNNLNRASYCVANLELVHDFSLIGISFGGEVSESYQVGKCEKTMEANIGEDLYFSVAYAPQKGSKAGAFSVSFNYGFNMDHYIKSLYKYFSGYPQSTLSPQQRMFRLHKHILQYLMRSGANKALTTEHSFIMKLLTLPALLASPSGKKIAKIFNFTKAELALLTQIKTKRPTSFKQLVNSTFEIMRRDADFYSCKNYAVCEELYVDFLNYFKILDETLDECHSINYSAAASNRYAFDLFSDFSFDVSMGYAVTEHDRSFQSNSGTRVLAWKEFSKHNFVSHSKTCENSSRKNGENFGRFLRLWGYGDKPKK